MKRLNGKGITHLLKALDNRLDEELEIILCGGAAGILKGSLARDTLDIDLITSIPKISHYSNLIQAIADEYSLSPRWLNDGAKGYVSYLPEDFKTRMEKLNNNFKYLRVFLLSNSDLFIMKLAALRAEDIPDIKCFKLNEDELTIVKETINHISDFDVKTAMKMKLYLEEIGLWN